MFLFPGSKSISVLPSEIEPASLGLVELLFDIKPKQPKPVRNLKRYIQYYNILSSKHPRQSHETCHIAFHARHQDSQFCSYMHMQVPTIEDLQDRGVYAIQASALSHLGLCHNLYELWIVLVI
jgi:hypothetical protein